MPCGCFAALRSLSHFFLLLPAFGQLLCPVCNFVHFVLRSAPLHPFVASRFASGHGIPPRRFPAIPGGMRMPLRKAIATILTGFHYAPLRPPFTSVASSPLAAFCCCARLAATGCVAGHRWHIPALIRLSLHATRYPFTVRPSSRYRGTLLYAPAGGTRRQFRRASSIALTASSPAPVWTSVPHRLSFLWPQALLPCYSKWTLFSKLEHFKNFFQVLPVRVQTRAFWRFDRFLLPGPAKYCHSYNCS